MADWNAPPVVLTSSKLQRIGAFALAALVGMNHPDALDEALLDEAVTTMTEDLLSTVNTEKAADPGGFWLGVSYMLWPNSKLNPTARGRQSPSEREKLIREWRARPNPPEWRDTPCAYCGRTACDWFGKVDIPLGASVTHRNTIAAGQEGTPLCFPCVASLWAFPYGAALWGGRAAAVHSWDDAFLAQATRDAVHRTRAAAFVNAAAPQKPGSFAREVAVLSAVRGYSRRITAGVELIVLSNANKEQVLATRELDQPLAEWIRSTTKDAAGYRALVGTQTAGKEPGEALFARRVFNDPGQVMRGAVDALLARISARTPIPDEAPRLAPLIYSYCREVLAMDDKNVERIREVARRLAALFSRDDRTGPFRDFLQAGNKGGNLHGWFRTKGVDWLLYPRPEGTPPVLLPVRDYRLLFEDERSWAWRRLLVFAVLEELAAAGWKPRGTKEEMEEITELAGATSADERAE